MKTACKVTRPREAAGPEHGDVLRAARFIGRIGIPVTQIGGRRLARPPSLAGGFAGLADLGVDANAVQEEALYQCPWSGNHYHWMFPLGILTDDEKRYGLDSGNIRSGRPWLCPMVSADMDENGYTDPTELDKITKAMLGHGYTGGTLPSDGVGEIVLATVPLDNGDEILVACWVWFNR